ncbi:MAG: hypothetical protein HZC55_05355 [Verrucomicrobia bacterium]|nr:hypothetical protein [Verrucomicrobiota bacterium]
MKPLTLLVSCLGLVSAVAAATSNGEPPVLLGAHAHNDYRQKRPLRDALDHGFGIIEADIWLVEERLLVAHDRKDVNPERTLQALYLEPLRERVRQNGGRVYRGGPTVTLVIDVKSEAGPTLVRLHPVLEQYAEMLTEFDRTGRRERAVTVILSGNRDQAGLAAMPRRLAALDGRREHLDSDVSVDLVPIISENWRTLSDWNWRDPMPESVRPRLAEWVQRAHARGRLVRFWGVPDRPDAWEVLLAAGVDVIGSDNLGALQAFLLQRRERARGADGDGHRPRP